MRKLETRQYHVGMAALNRAIILCQYIDAPSKLAEKKTDKVGKELSEVFIEMVSIAHTSASEMGLQVSAMALEELQADLQKQDKISFDGLELKLNEIDNTIRREVSFTKIFVVKNDRAKFIDSPEPLFGPDVDTKYPVAAADIQEAGGCLALGRSTAAVFHLMRVMEVGLRALNLCIGLPKPTGGSRNWGRMLDAIKKELEGRSQKGGPSWKGNDKQLFTELHGSLDAVRSAWRNQTMHIERSYNDDEAEHAFMMVRQFMKKLAGRCDVDGNPRA